MRHQAALTISRTILIVGFVCSFVPIHKVHASTLHLQYAQQGTSIQSDFLEGKYYKILLDGDFPEGSSAYYFQVVFNGYTTVNIPFRVVDNQLYTSGGAPNPDGNAYTYFPTLYDTRTGNDTSSHLTYACDGLLHDGSSGKVVGRLTGDLFTMVSWIKVPYPHTQISVSDISTLTATLGSSSCDKCNSCEPGKVTPQLGSIDLDISLGKSWLGDYNASLKLLSDRPMASLATPGGLMIAVGLDFQKATTNGVLQILGPQVLADIRTNSDYKYDILFYARTNVGPFTNGVYTITNGTHYKGVTVENPDTTNAVNRLFITEVESGVTNAITYIYTNTTATNELWTLTTHGGLSKETLAINWANTNYLERLEIRSILQPTNDTVVFQESKKYQRLTFGEALVEEVQDPNGANLLTTYSYYTNTANTSADKQRLGKIKEKTLPNGSWERYDYGDSGRVTTNVTGFLNNSISASNEAVRAVYTTYTNVNPIVTRVEKVLDQEVSRSYLEYGSDGTRHIQCQTVGATNTAADNLITVNNYYSPSSDFPNWIRNVKNPDRTMSFYTYATNSAGALTTTVTIGQTNGPGTAILEGTKTITVRTPSGQMISNIVVNITGGADGVVLARESYVYAPDDVFFRSPTITYLDGYTTQVNYDCCHLNNSVAKDGTVTYYTFDGLNRQTATTQNGITTTNVLDAAGRVLQTIRIGTDGSPMTLHQTQYDVAGRAVSETSALNGVTTYTNVIDGSGQTVITNIYADGSTRIETHFKDGSLAMVTGTAVHPVRYEYGVESESGVQRAYTKEIKLDASGNDTTEWTKTYTDMVGRAYKTVYAASSGTPFSISYYNTQGQLTNQVDPDGVSTLYAYNPKGEQTYTVIDSNRNYTIDFSGSDRITFVTNDVVFDNGSNVRRRRTYVWSASSAGSNLVSTSETSVDGLTSWNSIWNNGVAVTSTNQTTYDPANGYQTTTTLAPDGSYATSLSQFGWPVSQTRYDSTGAQIGQTTYGYDAQGRQNTTTDVRTGTMTSYFNNADQVSGLVTPVPGTGQSAQVTTNFFDNMGRVWKSTLPDNTSVTNEFFLTGQLKKTYGSRTYPVAYTYDAQGRMQTMKTWQDFTGNAGTATNTWSYDAYRGFLTGKTYDGPTAGPAYTYTAAGRLSTRTWARGTNTTYSYNNAGDLSAVSYNDGSTLATSYGYDRRGRQTVVTNGTAVSTLTYNDAGLLLAEANTGGTLNGLTVTNLYDSLLRRTTNGVWNGATWLAQSRFGYDNASRLASVSDGTNSATYSYLANSPLVSQIAFTNNGAQRMTTTKGYDNLNRLTNLVSTAGASTAAGFAYQYNAVNQRTASTTADNSYWVYQYDALGQVISGKKFWSDGTPVAGQQFEYAFDTIGNRQSTAAGGDSSGNGLRLASYSVNTLNQYTNRTVSGYVNVIGAANSNATVTVNERPTERYGEYYRGEPGFNNSTGAVYQVVTNLAVLPNGTNADLVTNVTGNVFLPQTPENFTYDADGNLTNDGRWTYTWDAENRLTQVVSLSGGPTASKRKVVWEYDYRGRRIRQTTSDGSSGSYAMIEDLKFLSDGWRCLAELNATNNALVRSYVWGLDLSDSLDGAGGVGGLLILNSVTNGVHFYAYDGNGNVAALVKASDGMVSANYEYDPFGSVLRATGSMATENRFQFSTKRNDRTTDLELYEFRVRRPDLAWFSRDPVSDDTGVDSAESSGGLNIYGFVGNNALSRVDWLGLAYGEHLTAEEAKRLNCAIRNWLSDALLVTPFISPDSRDFRPWTLILLQKFLSKDGGTIYLPYSLIEKERQTLAANVQGKKQINSGLAVTGVYLADMGWRNQDIATALGRVWFRYQINHEGGINGEIRDHYTFLDTKRPIAVPLRGLNLEGLPCCWKGGDVIKDKWMSDLETFGYAKGFYTVIQWRLSK